MAIINGQLKRKSTTTELVYSSDSDVTVPESVGNCGWIEPTLATSVAPSADRVVIRATDADKATEIRDIKGAASKLLAWCRAGVIEANGSRHRPDINAWLGKLAVNAPGALDSLGLAVEALTTGRPLSDLQAWIRRFLGDETEEVAQPEATKSDGG